MIVVVGLDRNGISHGGMRFFCDDNRQSMTGLQALTIEGRSNVLYEVGLRSQSCHLGDASDVRTTRTSRATHPDRAAFIYGHLHPHLTLVFS